MPCLMEEHAALEDLNLWSISSIESLMRKPTHSEVMLLESPARAVLMVEAFCLFLQHGKARLTT